MSVKPGYLASVRKGSVTIAELGQWSMSGFTRETLDSTAFGDAYKTFVVGIGDYGTISFSGNYDPDDSTGQAILNAACLAATELTDLYFYVDSQNFWKVTGAGAYILLTKCYAITADKSGICTIAFEGKVSGAMCLTNQIAESGLSSPSASPSASPSKSPSASPSASPSGA